ncbi:MAG: NIPSNAP family protein [Armatimonadota bacterium]|nr:NIPSNAP family protein [Armatimonadota bacterium]
MSERSAQLRIYTVAEGALGEFVARWRAGVRPLRERYGFVIEGAWTIPDQHRFVWILSYRGPGSFEEADAAYYASPERKALRPDPAELLVAAQTYWLSPLPA